MMNHSLLRIYLARQPSILISTASLEFKNYDIFILKNEEIYIAG